MGYFKSSALLFLTLGSGLLLLPSKALASVETTLKTVEAKQSDRPMLSTHALHDEEVAVYVGALDVVETSSRSITSDAGRVRFSPQLSAPAETLDWGDIDVTPQPAKDHDRGVAFSPAPILVADTAMSSITAPKQSDLPELPSTLPEDDVTSDEGVSEESEVLDETLSESESGLDGSPDAVLEATDLPPEDLLADPNPLAFPTTTEEVTIEETDVITLDEAVELAYFNNPDLQAAILGVEQSQAAVDQARAAWLPSVTATADAIFQETTGNATTVNNDRLDADLQVSYDVFTSGQRSASIRAAEAQLRFSELEVERIQEVLRLNTANLYYALQDATEQIRINQSFLDEASRNLRDNRIRQQEGVGTRFDVLRAEVQFANARQALIQSQSQQRIAQRDLARLLNLPTTRNVQATPVEQAEVWPLTLEESIVLAFQNRADLEQDLAQAEINEQQAIAARAAVGPQLSLFATYGVNDILDSFNDSNGYVLGAQFSWRLFDGGAANAAARQEEVAAEISEQNFATTLDQIQFDVEQAYFDLQANAENIDTAEVAVAQAQEALRLANLRLDAGVGTQLDVLTAQSELTQAEGNLVSALLGYNRALAALQRAVSNLEATI